VIQDNVLLRVLRALDDLGIEYMVIGSFASNYWGRPRATHDADLLVEIASRDAERLAGALEGEFYVSEEALREAAERRGQANVIHLEEGFKVDLWVRQEEPYDRERFRRRRRGTLFGYPAWITSSEDLILAKLRWYRAAPGLERQYQDALEVYEIQAPTLDQAYLDVWSVRLGVHDLLLRLREEAVSPD